MPQTIAITLGDPAGVGPEVIAKTMADRRLPTGFRFEVLGNPLGKVIPPGKSSRTSARLALEALESAIAGCRDDHYAAMVTGPVQKETITPLQPHFRGQTELLALRLGLPESTAVMTLTDPKLTVALCTHHCALRDALEQLTSARIVHVAQEVAAFLQLRGTAKARLALAGVNPHAGENGLFGDEEKRILQPALIALRRAGLDITGPHSPDTVFYRAIQGAFDAVVCAYHDQALIPFKLVAFHTGVNITLGLPIIRTSPDHGTAMDIAGKGIADHRSMLSAVQLACRLARMSRSKNL